ncbi:MAG: DNA repair and recombination protein RadB [Thermoplasmata archaeon]
MKIGVDCPSLDDLLDGGIETGCITLLFGEAGSGKTNLCLQVARNVVRSGRKVVYIDTEGVSLDRLRQICGGDFEAVIKDILFSEVYTLEEQEEYVGKAVRLAEMNKEVGLIILDSATTHYRMTKVEEEREERHSLTRQITNLMQAARKRDIPVLVTSQVYTDLDRGIFEPLGGHMLSHNAKDIVRLGKAGLNLRLATIVKHRHLQEGLATKFRLTDRGLES